MAKLYFRYGSMNSGKSTNLIQAAYNYEERGMKVALIKPGVDKKGGDKLVSRIGAERKVDLIVDEKDNVYEEIKSYINDNGKLDCILVDEAQFLKAIQIDELFKVAVILNIPVICYGLRTDFKTQGFEGSVRLLSIAHSIEEMKTICGCGRKAVLNGRKVNGKFVIEADQVAIDTVDNVEYESLCGNCYYKHNNLLK